MSLEQEDFEALSNHVKENIGTWLAEQSLAKPPVIYEIELRERMVRVEEELKHQRELMKEGFEMTNKRFEELREDMNKRFEQVRDNMNKRFEQVDKRFEVLDSPSYARHNQS